MDCDNQEIEATKTIGSTDVEKVLKKLKNKNTKESIILLDYIGKLEKENKELKKANKKLQADIELKDKVIDELINFLLNYDIDEDYCKKIERQECNKYKEGYCDKCIKQHFYKKVEEENE